MPIPIESLQEIVRELASRPGHEKVRAHLHRLLTDGLGAPSTDVQLEKPVPEVRGRLDALLGRTVFEIKSNLRAERGDAEGKLTRYLGDRQNETGEHYVGIATNNGSARPFWGLRRGAGCRHAFVALDVRSP